MPALASPPRWRGPGRAQMGTLSRRHAGFPQNRDKYPGSCPSSGLARRLARQHDRLRAAAHAQLAEQIGHVVARGLLRDAQLPRDLRVAAALAQQPQHRALALGQPVQRQRRRRAICTSQRSEEHTSELQSLMRISYAVFCLKKKNQTNNLTAPTNYNHDTPLHHQYTNSLSQISNYLPSII